MNSNNDVLYELLDTHLNRLITNKQIKHAVMGIEKMDKSLRWVGAVGKANPDGEEMSTDTPYMLASITKLYIAAAILKLHEHQQLNLDEPVLSYLPRDLVGGIHRLNGIDYSDRITIRNLLGHTSGLPDFFEEGPKGDKALGYRIVEEGDIEFSIRDVVEVVKDKLTPHFPPQPKDALYQKARYSDTNYQLLIAIIKAVRGQPLQQAFEDLIFKPLNLRNTWLPGYGSPELPDAATFWGGEQPMNIPLALRSFKDLYGTIDDTLDFLRALLQGKVFENPSTFELMKERWNTFQFSFSLTPLSPGWPIQYGLGMMRFELPRIFTPFKPLPTVIGHTGVTGSWLFYCQELDILLTGTVDQMTAAPLPFRFMPKLLNDIRKSITPCAV